MVSSKTSLRRRLISKLEAAAYASTSAPKRVKDLRKRPLDTVFGRVTVRCRRFVRCTCSGGKARNLYPLAHWADLGMKRSKPERTYLLAECGSKLPYRKAAELLEELMPASFERALPYECSSPHVERWSLAGSARDGARRIRLPSPTTRGNSIRSSSDDAVPASPFLLTTVSLTSHPSDSGTLTSMESTGFRWNAISIA
jgi:hypothetical protein